MTVSKFSVNQFLIHLKPPSQEVV